MCKQQTFIVDTSKICFVLFNEKECSVTNTSHLGYYKSLQTDSPQASVLVRFQSIL